MDCCWVWEAAQVEEGEKAEAGPQVRPNAKAKEQPTQATSSEPIPHERQIHCQQNGRSGSTTCWKLLCSRLLRPHQYGDLVPPEDSQC